MRKISRVAFFPGKFQPPHLGHVETINRILDDYDKVIVGVTEDGPRVMPQKQVGLHFYKAFRHLRPDKFVEIIFMKGKLCNWSKAYAMMNLPDFDILITAENSEVEEWAKSLEIPVENIPRSKGIAFSGTELRSIYEQRTKNKGK